MILVILLKAVASSPSSATHPRKKKVVSAKDELIDLLHDDVFWPYKRWAVRALVAQGRKAEAIRLAEASRGPWTSDTDVDALCEEILLSSGLTEEAYARYGVRSNRGGTYLARFRALAKRYPHKHAEDEFFFVLEGTAEFYLNGKTKTAGPYTSFYCPPNSEHGIRNTGDSVLKYLVIKKYEQ